MCQGHRFWCPLHAKSHLAATMEFDGGETAESGVLTRGFSSIGSFRSDGLLPVNRTEGEEDEVIDIMTITHGDDVATEPNTRREDDSPFSLAADEAHFGSQPESGTSMQSLTHFVDHRDVHGSAFDTLDHEDAFSGHPEADNEAYRLAEAYAALPDAEDASGDRENPALNSSLNVDDANLFANMVPQSMDDGFDDTEHNVEWVGECIKEIGSRRFYDACRVDSQEFHAYDHAEIRSRELDDTRPAVARIIALYEQNGQKKVALEWFLRFSDVQKHIEYMRSIEVHAPTPPPQTNTPPPPSPASSSSQPSLSQSAFVQNTNSLASSGSFGAADANMLRSSDDATLMKRKRGRPPKKRHQNMEDTVEYMQRRGQSELYTTSHPTVSESSAAVLYRKCEVVFANAVTDPEVPAKFRVEGAPSFYWYRKALDLKTCALTGCKPRGPRPKNYIEALEKRYRNAEKKSGHVPLVPSSSVSAQNLGAADNSVLDGVSEEDSVARERKRLRPADMETTDVHTAAMDVDGMMKPKLEPIEMQEEDISIEDSGSEPLGHIPMSAKMNQRFAPLRVGASPLPHLAQPSAFPGARADYVYPALMQKMTAMEDLLQRSVAAIQSYLEETKSDVRRGIRDVQKLANATTGVIVDTLKKEYPDIEAPAPLRLAPSPPPSPRDTIPAAAVSVVSSSAAVSTVAPPPIVVKPLNHTSSAAASAPPPKKRKVSTEKTARASIVKPKEGIQPLPSTWQAPSLSLSTVSPGASSGSSTYAGATTSMSATKSKKKKSSPGDESGAPAKKKQKISSSLPPTPYASGMVNTALHFSSPLVSPVAGLSSASSEPSYSPRVSLVPSEDSNSSAPGAYEVTSPLNFPPMPQQQQAPHLSAPLTKPPKRKRLPAPPPPNAVVSDYGTRSKRKN